MLHSKNTVRALLVLSNGFLGLSPFSGLHYLEITKAIQKDCFETSLWTQIKQMARFRLCLNEDMKLSHFRLYELPTSKSYTEETRGSDSKRIAIKILEKIHAECLAKENIKSVIEKLISRIYLKWRETVKCWHSKGPACPCIWNVENQSAGKANK